MSDCIFCKVINKEFDSKVIYENQHVLAFLDIFPNSDGHSLIVPKKHFENLEKTDDFYLHEVAKAKKIVAKLLKEKLNPEGFNYISNQGQEAFQTVFHYHEHIIPKYKKDKGYTFKIVDNEKAKENVGNVFKKIKE